jgi:hypothetical protein
LPQRVTNRDGIEYRERDADAQLIDSIPLAMSDPEEFLADPPSIEDCLADYANCSDCTTLEPSIMCKLVPQLKFAITANTKRMILLST